jgi:hypothetical protein
MKKLLLSLILAGSLLASPVQALTLDQISAVLNLLKAFGVEGQVLEDVRVALHGGGTGTTPAPVESQAVNTQPEPQSVQEEESIKDTNYFGNKPYIINVLHDVNKVTVIFGIKVDRKESYTQSITAYCVTEKGEKTDGYKGGRSYNQSRVTPNALENSRKLQGSITLSEETGGAECFFVPRGTETMRGSIATGSLDFSKKSESLIFNF